MSSRPRKPRADLHLHSTASDGLLAPCALAAAVAERGIAVAALTDHDTTAGFPEFAHAARPLGVTPIPGAEIAALHEGEEVHLLAYFARRPDGPFQALLERLSAQRHGRAEEMLRRLAALGMVIEAEVILSHPQVGRPHVARALVAAGYARDIQDAFTRFLTPGTSAYVERARPSAEDAIARAHDEGGLMSLAHPAHYQGAHLRALAAAGLDAVETNHPSAERGRRDALRRQARRLGLLVTGGSDYHGAPRAGPGDAGLGPADAQRFLALLDANSQG